MWKPDAQSITRGTHDSLTFVFLSLTKQEASSHRELITEKQHDSLYSFCDYAKLLEIQEHWLRGHSSFPILSTLIRLSFITNYYICTPNITSNLAHHRINVMISERHIIVAPYLTLSLYLCIDQYFYLRLNKVLNYLIFKTSTLFLM